MEEEQFKVDFPMGHQAGSWEWNHKISPPGFVIRAYAAGVFYGEEGKKFRIRVEISSINPYQVRASKKVFREIIERHEELDISAFKGEGQISSMTVTREVLGNELRDNALVEFTNGVMDAIRLAGVAEPSDLKASKKPAPWINL